MMKNILIIILCLVSFFAKGQDSLMTSKGVKRDTASLLSAYKSAIATNTTSINNRVQSTSKSVIGYVVNDNFARASLGSSYNSTLSSATVTFPSSAKLNVTGGNSNYSNFIEYNQYLDYEHFVETVTVIPKVLTATSAISVGIMSKQASSIFGIIAKFDLSSNTANSGKITVTMDTSATAIVSSIVANPIIVGDTLLITIVRYKNQLNFQLFNKTQGTTSYVAYTYDAQNATIGMPNINMARIWFQGGTQDITSFAYYCPQVVGKHSAFVGNSITAGYGSASYIYAPSDILYKNNYNVYSKDAGGGEYSIDAVNKSASTNALLPKYIIYDYGVNDLGHAVSQVTFIANMDTLIQRAIRAGIIPIVLSITPSTGGGAATWNSALSSLCTSRSVKYVDTYNVLNGGSGTTLAAKYNYDGTHPNQLGYEVLAGTISFNCPELFTYIQDSARLDNSPYDSAVTNLGVNKLGQIVKASNILLPIIPIFTTSINTTSTLSPLIIGGTSASANLQLQSTSNATKGKINSDNLYVVGTTLSGSSQTSNFFNVTGTLPSTMTTQTQGVYVNLATAGSSSQAVLGLRTDLTAGYTGASITEAGSFNNSVAGTGNVISGTATINGNFGFIASSNGAATASANVGALGWAGTNLRNVGFIGDASFLQKNSASALSGGVIGLGLRANASAIEFGGYFGLQTTQPTFASAALIADNGAEAVPIQLWRNNGTVIGQIGSGGSLRIGDATAPTDKLEVTGNFALTTAGNKLKIATGANASINTATLVAGTVTVSTTAVTSASKIFIQVTTPGGTQGFLSVPTIVTGTSFTVNSTSATETSSFNWLFIN